jgi:TonB-dependent starch-binding outer membrane protein SusC
MKTFIRMSLILLFASHYYVTKAQNKATVIHGKVISFEESFPLEGVTIIVKNTAKSKRTQSDGTFSLSTSPEDKILVISLADYQVSEVSLSSIKIDYEIVLKRNGN